MSQELSAVLESYSSRGKEFSGDWADQKALQISAQFVALDGAENWHLPDFNWPELNRMIASALRGK